MAVKNLVDSQSALEVARRANNPDAFTIIETMAQSNTMLQEMPAIEANNNAIHNTLLRRSYPGGEHRIYNRGVGRRSSQTEPIEDRICMLEAFSDVDIDLATQSGNPAALYQSEATAFLIGMGLDQADDLIYGNHATNPEEINGLAIRCSKAGDHCVPFTGKGKGLTSVYLVAAGVHGCHLIYPKGSNSVGVQRIDAGIMYVKDEDDAKKEFRVHRDHFKADYGIVVAHPDAVIRICNIPPNMDKAQRAELIEKILEFQKKLTIGLVNTVLFANQSMIYQIERAGREAQYVVHPETDPWGKPVSSINGLRLRGQDAILFTEDEITAA